MDRWFVLHLNAEPWAVGPLGVGRRKGGTYPYIGPNKQLTVFQESIREQLGKQVILEGDVEITFYISRCLFEYFSPGGRKGRAHEADATNMQKGIEDALQKVIIDNDRQVKKIQTTIVEQSQTAKSFIIINVKPYVPDLSAIPTDIWNQVNNEPELPFNDDSFEVSFTDHNGVTTTSRGRNLRWGANDSDLSLDIAKFRAEMKAKPWKPNEAIILSPSERLWDDPVGTIQRAIEADPEDYF